MNSLIAIFCFLVIASVASGSIFKKRCPRYEIFTVGGSCPEICDEPPATMCAANLVYDCFCVQDFIRKTRGGPCIPIWECPRFNSNIPAVWDERSFLNICPDNEIYLSGSSCQETCDEPRITWCYADLVNDCYCNDGFIRKYKGGPCIPEWQCPNNYYWS